MTSKLIFLILLSQTSLVLGGMMHKPRKLYSGYKLLRVPNIASDYQDVLIQTLEQRDTVQLWRVPKENNSVEILVGQSRYDEVVEFLREIEVEPQVIHPDISILLNEEREKYMSPTGTHLSFEAYHDYEDIINYFTRKSGNMSGIQLIEEVIGKSEVGRDIYLFKVSKNGDGARRAIWIDSGLHGRDWLAISTSTYILDRLLSGDFDTLLEEYDFYFVPVINPDGYHFTRTIDRFWAKNLGVRSNNRGCEGVNLDRNFALMYRGELMEIYSKGTGVAHNPCSDYFGGDYAHIEAEVTALTRAVWGKREEIALYFSLQSYSQVWLLPRESMRENDFDQLTKLAEIGNEALEKKSGKKYLISTWEYSQAEPPGKCIDWMKQIAGINYSFGVKVRDDGMSRGYLVPATEIKPVGDEILAAIKAMALYKSAE